MFCVTGPGITGAFYLRCFTGLHIFSYKKVNYVYMKPRHLLLAAAISLSCVSCLSLGLKLIGAYNNHADMAVFANEADKTVAYIAMRHIGTKEFYNDVKHKVDSLQGEGYIVFMESVRVTDSLTPAQKDTLQLKIRKITGVHIGDKGYIDTINNRLLGRRYKNRRGLINQPKYHELGVDTLSGRIVDIPMNRLVEVYEEKYGSLWLNPCDWTTRPEEKYDCGKEPKGQYNYLVLSYRNKHLADEVTREKHNKIAIIYGASHEWGLFKDLKAIDSTWAYKKRILR